MAHLPNEAMKFATKIVIDIGTGRVIERQEFDWEGPIALAKGGNSKAEMQQANQISQQQLQMMQQQLAMVDPSLQQIIANGGMLPSTQAAMTSTAMNSLPAQYQNLAGQINNALVQRGVTGGTNAGGGAVAQSYGQLGQAEAQQQSNLLNQIQMQKAGNLNTALGIGAGLTGTFNQGGLQALGTATQAAGQADQAQTGFMGSLFGALASPFNLSATI